MSVDLRAATGADLPALMAFFERVPAGERTFFKEDVADAAEVERRLHDPGRRVLAVRGDDVVGYLAVVPLRGWCDHVGEIRLVVDPACRGQQLGRALARRAVLEAVDLRLRKLVVEVVAAQEGAVAMFEHLGFRAEGLLRDHVRDRDGNLQDLVVLGHLIDDAWAEMATAGIADAVGEV